MNITALHTQNTVKSDQLSFKNNVFVAEISDFGPDFQFKVDSLGVPSFFIQSAKTGEVRTFRFIADTRNDDNEVTDMIFRCTDASFRHLTARIFND
ncbi:hypothetical protein D3C87_666520 [compost metagenome]